MLNKKIRPRGVLTEEQKLLLRSKAKQFREDRKSSVMNEESPTGSMDKFYFEFTVDGIKSSQTVSAQSMQKAEDLVKKQYTDKNVTFTKKEKVQNEALTEATPDVGVTEAFADYTGGGIYVFYGKINGQYFYGGNANGIGIFNRKMTPGIDNGSYDISKNLVRMATKDEVRAIFDYLRSKQNLSRKDNYLVSDMDWAEEDILEYTSDESTPELHEGVENTFMGAEDAADYRCDICGKTIPYDDTMWLNSWFGLCPDCYDEMDEEDKELMRDNDNDSELTQKVVSKQVESLPDEDIEDEYSEVKDSDDPILTEERAFEGEVVLSEDGDFDRDDDFGTIDYAGIAQKAFEEPITEPTPENNETVGGAPAFGEDSGVASMLNGLIKSEYDAIEDYNAALATLNGADKDYSEMINVITDIVGEEHVHVGQLTELMKIVSPNVARQEEGQKEAEEQIEEPVGEMPK